MKKLLRVFADTTILFSGLFYSGCPNKLLKLAGKGRFRLVLGRFVIEELIDVIKTKAPQGLYDLDKFLAELEYDEVKLPSISMVRRYGYALSSMEDAAVLASVILSDVDYFVSGDTHFHNEKVKQLVDLVTCPQLLKIIERK